jgi:hypothetical protein
MTQSAQATSIPAPVGGLNDFNSYADMPPQDAVIMTNWWPQPTRLQMRPGSLTQRGGFAAPVETLAVYEPFGGTGNVFGVASGNIYDVTNSQSTSAPEVSGLSNSRFESVQITTPGGAFLYLVNGIDDPQLFNGTTWSVVNNASTPINITGVDPSTFTQGCLFANRLFFVERNSLNAWILPVQSVGGAATKFPLGGVFRRGGSLVGIYDWTIDGGAGADDHCVFISSNGEVAVYQGTDPTTAANWSLIGVYYVGRPVGLRCAAKYGGDLIILCEQGLLPLSQALQSATINRSSAITLKIQNSISQAINQYRNNFGWELCVYPEQNALIINIPAGFGQNYQFVQNTISGAWTKFVGWNAITFRDSKYGLYFGSANNVVLAWINSADDGRTIQSEACQAFNYFGSPGQNKQFTMVRPYLYTNGNPAVLFNINGDFYPQPVQGQLDYVVGIQPMVWGKMTWGKMFWSGFMRLLANWSTVGGIYHSAALHIRVQNNNSTVEWVSTDFMYNPGGYI